MTQAQTMTFAPQRPVTQGPPTFANTLSSEWTKMRTLRSTFITVAVSAALVIGLSALITWAAYGAPHHGQRAITDPVGVIQSGWLFGLLAFGVLGVLVVTNEYSSGMITSTLLVTPGRIRVLLAKVVVFSVVMFVAGEVMTFINFLVGHAVLSAFPAFYDPGLGDNDVLRAVIGMGLDAVLVGLIGLSLGALFRNAAAAIAVAVGVLWIGPIVFSFLPSSIQNPLNEYWPTEAGSQLEEVTRQSHALTAWWGTGDLVLFVLALLVVAGYALVKRDA
ncbi:MAG TPA: ABC transporter permease [Acidimicrobiales bacterium]|nr:ABC transporter permease [Acidimicrobiales bacterium]